MNKQNRNSIIGTKNKQVVTRGDGMGVGGGKKQVREIKRHKLPGAK